MAKDSALKDGRKGSQVSYCAQVKHRYLELQSQKLISIYICDIFYYYFGK